MDVWLWYSSVLTFVSGVELCVVPGTRLGRATSLGFERTTAMSSMRDQVIDCPTHSIDLGKVYNSTP